MRFLHTVGRFSRALAALSLAGGGAAAFAQSEQRACFVANNGNLEGSVTSFVFDAGNVPVLVDRVITGVDPDPGTNPYGITLSPGGRWLATSHTTISSTFEQITLIEVSPDATLRIAGEFQTDDSPLDLQWINDEYLAVTRTSLSVQNQVIVYRFDGADPNAPTLSEVDRENTGRFTGYMAVHPNRQIIYTADSTDNWIRAFAVAADGTLTLLQTMPTGGTFPLGIDVSPDGTKLYGGGGISNSGNKVVGYLLAGDGTLTQMAGSPFISPGASPKLARFSPDSSILYVAHGTDATVRSFLIDSESGALTSTGFSFDVGLQGSHGDHVTLDEMLLITDDTTAIDGLRGLYSFDRLADGDFTMNGAIVDTQGVGPTEIAGWTPPPCVGDFDGDKTVGLSDLAVMLGAFGTCSGDPGYVAAADLDGSGCVDLVDLSTLLGVFGSTC